MRRQQTSRRDRQRAAEPAQEPECPRCGARLSFARSDRALIDACGFESYRLECEACGVRLAGIIDPADDTLLLSELAA